MKGQLAIDMDVDVEADDEPQVDAYPYSGQVLVDFLARHDPEHAVAVAGEALGVPPRTIYRWIKRGFTYWQAEQIAVHRLGRTPNEIWTDWYER